MGGKFKSCSLLCWWRRGELVLPEDKPAEEVCLERMGVGGNCLWWLAIVVVFMELRRPKGLEGLGGFKVIIWGTASHRGGKTNFCVWEGSWPL